MTKSEVVDEQSTEATKKRSHKLRTALIIVVVPILAFVLVLGWFGFVPGLSTILGATKPRDLGVRYTEKDMTTYLQKTGVVLKDFATAPVNPENPSKKVVFADPVSVVGQRVTQEEATALANSANWAWMPLKNIQIRLSNNTAEVSGNINTAHMEEFVRFIGGVGYGEGDVHKAVSWGRKFAASAPIYAKLSLSIDNNRVSSSLQEIQIGRFNVAKDIANKVIGTGLTNVVNNAANFDVVSGRLSPGFSTFTGTYPTTVYVKH